MKTAIVWLLRLGLGAVFFYAEVMKLRDPAGFTEEIAGHRLLLGVVEGWLAVYLPWLEVAGMGVLLPQTVRGAAWLQAGLMGVFIVALSLAWGRGLDINCGFFGGGTKAANYPWLIGRDVVFLIGSGLVLFWADLSALVRPDRDEERIASDYAAPYIQLGYYYDSDLGLRRTASILPGSFVSPVNLKICGACFLI